MYQMLSFLFFWFILTVLLLLFRNYALKRESLIVVADSGKVITDNHGHVKGEHHIVKFIELIDNGIEFEQSVIKSLPYSYRNSYEDRITPGTSKRLKPLLRHSHQDRYYFLCPEMGFDYVFFKVESSMFGEKLLFNERRIIKDVDFCHGWSTFVDYNPDKDMALVNDGILLNLKTNKFDFTYFSLAKTRLDKEITKKCGLEKSIVHNCKYVKDDLIIMQCSDGFGGDRFEKHRNYILLLSDDGSINKLWQIGNYPIYYPAYENRMFSPIDISPDKKRIAFIAEKTDNIGRTYGYYLCVLDTQTGTYKWIHKLGDSGQKETSGNFINSYMFTPAGLRWSPDSKSDLIALHTVDELLIINVKEDKVKRFPRQSQVYSMRWSNRGDKLAVVEVGGSLLVYDSKTGKLREAAKDQDYFDVLWVY